MTLEEVCLEYDRLARLRDSLKAALANYQAPLRFTRQEVELDKDHRRRAIHGLLSQLYWMRNEYENLGGLGVTEREILMDAQRVLEGQEVRRWSE